MALSVWQRNVVTESGDVIPDAEIEVFDAGETSKPDLFSDPEGTTAITNPFNADTSGFARFYVAGGRYDIAVNGVVTWEDVSLGTAQYRDTGTEPESVPTNSDADARGFAQSVDSVADLRAASFPDSLERIWLSGYYGVGTAGGGPLYRDSDDTVSEDNGGTVFVDGDGVRWKRPVSKETYLSMWGAQEGQDATSALESALFEDEYQVIVDGAYICGAAVDGVSVDIRAAFGGKLAIGSDALNILSITNAPKVHIEGLYLDASEVNENRTGFDQAGLVLYDCPVVSIKNNEADDVYNTLIHGELSYGFTGHTSLNIANNRFNSSAHFGTESYSSLVNFQGRYEKGSIKNNDVFEATGNAFRIYPATDTDDADEPPRNFVFSKNKISKCVRTSDGEGACLYYRGHDLYLSDNSLELAGRHVVDIQGPDSQTTLGENIHIANNTFMNQYPTKSSAGEAIVLLRACNSIVTGNTFLGPGADENNRGLTAKWGGSLIAVGNSFPRRTVDGYDHFCRDAAIEITTSANINDFGFEFANIADNHAYNRFDDSALLRIRNNGDLTLNKIHVHGNTLDGSNGNIVRVRDSTPEEDVTWGTPRTRNVKIGGNVGFINIIDPDTADNVFRLRLNDVVYGTVTALESVVAVNGLQAFVLGSEQNRPAWYDGSDWRYADGTIVS